MNKTGPKFLVVNGLSTSIFFHNDVKSRMPEATGVYGTFQMEEEDIKVFAFSWLRD